MDQVKFFTAPWGSFLNAESTGAKTVYLLLIDSDNEEPIPVFSSSCRKLESSGISRMVRPIVFASAGLAACKKEECRNMINDMDRRNVRKVFMIGNN